MLFRDDKHNTQKVSRREAVQETPHEVIKKVCCAMREKNYDPTSQLVGYFLTEDPTYITSHKNARTNISKLERYQFIEEVVRYYIEHSIDEEV